MKEIASSYTDKTFDSIKQIDEYGNEYWYARDLSKILEYRDWRNFLKVLNKAKEACENSGFDVDEQLVEVNKLSKRNNNATVNIQDFKLTIYMCYLIVQNADLKKLFKQAKDVHYDVGKKVRQIIANIAVIMPEKIPTSSKSLKEL